MLRYVGDFLEPCDAVGTGKRGVLLNPGTEKLEIRKCGNEEMAHTNESFTDCVCPCWLEEAQPMGAAAGG